MTMRLYGDVSKEHIKMVNDLMLCHAESLQDLSQAKKWEQIMQIQGDFLAKVAIPLNEYAQHMIDATLEGNSNYSKWLEDNFEKNTQAFKENVKETVKEGKQLQEKALGKPHQR